MIAERYGVRAYTDIAMMLSKERPDLVSLCLPNQGHFETTLQVIQAGYPLLVEKPLVFDVGEAETLIEEAAKRNQPPPIHARVGLRALKLAYVAIESFERGVRVML